jgi:hypothetical protein
MIKKIKCYLYGHEWKLKWRFIVKNKKDGFEYYNQCTRCKREIRTNNLKHT